MYGSELPSSSAAGTSLHWKRKHLILWFYSLLGNFSSQALQPAAVNPSFSPDLFTHASLIETMPA